MMGAGGVGRAVIRSLSLTAASSPRPELSHGASTEGDGCAAQGMDGRMEEGGTDGGFFPGVREGGGGLTEQGRTCPLVLSADLLTSLQPSASSLLCRGASRRDDQSYSLPLQMNIKMKTKVLKKLC